jgi:prephenate dehydratase
MAKMKIICPGGKPSHTGAAISQRYPSAEIVECDDIGAVRELLASPNTSGVIPIWNSHAGEVMAATYVWDDIQASEAKIVDLWAKKIEFWFLQKRKLETHKDKLIGSVVVAEQQCSSFLKNQHAKLSPRKLTTIALKQYLEGAPWAGVLVAEGQGENETALRVVKKKTANPCNFTSFIRVVSAPLFDANQHDSGSRLTCVSMRSFGSVLGDTEQSFFDRMLGDINDLANVPRLVFVLNRDAKVGLIFEGQSLYERDLLDATELQESDISIYENAGSISALYSEELKQLFSKEFPSLIESDFVLHCGENTCLFACPPLNIFTHGYDRNSVEPAFRFYISRLFQRWIDGVDCTRDQSIFFERHRVAWEQKRSEFIEFSVLR